ncbi:MAG TPA: recombinase family protein [bacterium]|nr:recombinase family protein [bacterium]
MVRVGLYARCSTADKQDPEGQLLQLRQYAASRGWEIVGEFTDHTSAVNLRGRVGVRGFLGRAGLREHGGDVGSVSDQGRLRNGPTVRDGP